MIQFWQQILPIWNAQNRQNPVAGHTCLNSNMQSAKFWLSLLTEYKKAYIMEKITYIWQNSWKAATQSYRACKMAASCINTVTEYVIVVWLWCISVFLLEFIETRSAKMEFPCSETGHGGFIIACILSIFRLESVKRGDKGSSDKRMAAGRQKVYSGILTDTVSYNICLYIICILRNLFCIKKNW